MKKRTNTCKALALIATLALLISLPLLAVASANGLTVQRGYSGAGGTSLNVVTIRGDLTPKIIFANGVPNSAAPVSEMIEDARAQGNLVAAFVGTFFDSYDGTNQTYGAMYRDGQYIHHGSYNAYLTYTRDGQWKILDGSEIIAFGTENVAMAVACTPRLVRGGQKSIETSEPDSFMLPSAQRTLVGVRADGTLVVATGATTFERAAETLLQLGCVDGMAMDGGASSFLYANGATLQGAGRDLNNIIAIYGVHAVEAPPGGPDAAQSAGSGISVTVNGRALSFDQPPISQDGRTLVPLRAIFEALGADVDWNPATQTVSAKRDDVSITLRIGSRILVRNGVDITLDVPAQTIGGRTLVPVRAIAESFGAEVGWNPATRTVTITE